ncbi:5365_t:CDS:2 [Entrophospora sp. SA101]|nr:5365_t:CDS:2 [Entrophospora sp. SA101]CAJ0846587.1 8325_t:CDS:2 [Entrophospora sp. SA101]CAJ0922122.1 12707_t:CDS:2 [Entrophospora sp. SA101]
MVKDRRPMRDFAEINFTIFQLAQSTITQSNPPDETEKDKSTDEELKVKEEETDEQVEIYLADVMKQLEKEPLFEVYGVSKFNSNSSATFSMLNRKIP